MAWKGNIGRDSSDSSSCVTPILVCSGDNTPLSLKQKPVI